MSIVIEDPVVANPAGPVRMWVRQNILCDHYSVHTSRTFYGDGRVFACLRCGVCQKQMSPGVEFGKAEEA